MLVEEEGPFRAFARLRGWSGIEYDSDGNMFAFSPANPLVCVLCLSVWLAPIMIACKPLARVFAVSGLACMVQIYGDSIDNN
jgi:hypothetical protein